ncbi:hypothetical protein GCM10008927_03670 [Amylibacter ulvae]|uniref:N-acetyltransferase domain-containing protein n=1 Tax=Paramylibacter ulvae TaxID=1651968 RepID=A0ABQ3CV26_9RHOB|nr:GNAT family N-acetyltransferase [Amylibacter ulvae]GHA42458.1 hypothetical protein GCM10008927_03670 [Amylibacter ulvae]
MKDVIQTKRLTLRHFTSADAPAVAKALNDYEVARWLSSAPNPYGLDDAKKFINKTKSMKIKPFAIFDQNQFVGCIGTDGLVGLGYWIAQDHWGKGYASEAVRAVVNWHFSNPKNTELRSGYIADNDKSAAVQQKLGFQITEYNTVDTVLLGTVDHVNTVLTRDAWLTSFNLPIESARIFLRPLSLDDWHDMQSISGNRETARMVSKIPVPWPESQVKQMIADTAFRGQVGFMLAICLHGGRMIGVIGLGGDKDPSVAYVMSNQFKGRGLTTEALNALLHYSFKTFDLPSIASEVFTDNPASMRVLEKAGFEKCGESIEPSKARLEPSPVFLYRLTRHKFESQNK